MRMQKQVLMMRLVSCLSFFLGEVLVLSVPFPCHCLFSYHIEAEAVLTCTHNLCF